MSQSAPKPAVTLQAKALEVVGLKKAYATGRDPETRKTRFVHALDDVSLSVEKGEVLGLVGESGCGKTTLSRAIMGLTEVDDGTVFVNGRRLTNATRADLRKIREHMQMVFQDPYASLNPLMPVRNILAEPMANAGLPKVEQKARILDLVSRVGLRPDQLDRTSRDFSGGQRQRIGIARALALQPDLLICDEPVSALDVSVQADVLNLFLDLQRDLGLAMLFVTHDMAVVEYVSQRVAVMYAGMIVEIGPTRDVIHAPKHPYTKALISAIPRSHPGMEKEQIVLPDSFDRNAGTGCPFAPRCQMASELCRSTRPPKIQTGGQVVACHMVEAQ
ncbi:ABC transporter ATP-binding protein [Celeribacter persicus]|uniref:Peptide/nickel transport system ATP-binding protein/oligopeptide transport system ATP-binding protein n=1 Tax=Celeribacter persicus TaxID=1651082 RepID=A0A2T5HUY8_9RHOB|nr:oligopeptide/dipeptide ABC transporter ATP-binding protein [Celeribacter persicus]PTQ75298.1 peptide/nickel transport system ATP-binding protein/oligopeptide transport system ATP-binding protein [Celeribacter persicus]